MHKKHRYYCGAWWVPRWIRKILSIKFNASCRVHDLDYASGSFTREEVDTRFLLHMIRQSKESVFWEIMATFFYIFVRLLGKFSWRRKK